MPYLNGEPFVKRQPPSDFSLDEEVFFLPTTLEVFRDYDDYFERTILVNSLAWTCSVCSRGPSTYKEAVACERSDYRQLSAFDNALASGLLYIIAGARKRRLPELVELICGFASSRFFVGEEIEFQTADSNVRSLGIIDRVVVSQKRNQFEHTGVLADSDIQKPAFPDALKLHYCVRDHKRPDGANHISSSILVPGSIISRRSRNVLARDHIKFFIRHTCELRNGVFTPKISIMQRYKLHPYGPITWNKLFLPPEPRWSEMTLTPPSSVNRTSNYISKESSRPVCQGFKVIDTYLDERSNRSQQKITSNVSSPTISNHNMISPSGTTRVQYFEPLGFESHKILYQQTHALMSGTYTMNGSFNQSSPHSAYVSRSLKVEKTELEKEWSIVRRREDLELPDLVPLPEFTKFPTSLSPDDIGSALQLLEFFHVFGPHIGFIVPQSGKSAESISTNPFRPTCSSLKLSTLESSLLESDPCGPLADCFISMLSAIRKFELDANSRQPTPNASAATIAAASAVAAAEAGFSVNTQISHVSGTGIDYNSPYDEDAAGPEDSALFRVLREAGASTRLCELIGIPTQAAAIAAGKAAVAVSNALSTTGGTIVKEDSSGISSSIFLNAVNRNSVTRAATTAVIAGAASLPPLDRAGLSEALWLHITSAAAKGGGWRGQIWGGTRPLDDPSVMLARNNSALVEKLKKVSVYELTPHEKLVLLTTLMDEILLQPQIRERMEDQYERVRLLRNQLRTIQADRTLFISCSSEIEEDQEVLSHIKKINSINEGRVHFTPIGFKGRINRGRGRPLSRKNAQLDSTVIPLETYLSDKDYTLINGSRNRPHSDTATTAPCVSSSHVPSMTTIQEKLAESLLEEQKLLDAITQVSRGCSIIPLGQDRFYRQYWLVMSVPCILIEDCSCPDKNPYFTNATIRNRQIVYTHPELAKQMGLNSCEDAAKHLRETINSIKDSESLDREALTYRVAASLPRQFSSSGDLSLEQLRSLVKPERVSVHDSSLHNACPAVSQLARLRCSSANSSPFTTAWSILIPDWYVELYQRKALNTADHTANCDANTEVVLSPTTRNCFSDLPVKSEECTSNTTANNNDFTDDNESKCKIDPSEDNDISFTDEEVDKMIEQAKWTIDCLEASLNPRGIRESRLRKTIGQLRPLLIKVITMCPPEIIYSMTNNCSTLVNKTIITTQNTYVSSKSVTITAEKSGTPSCKPTHSIMCSWLEIALVGIGYRLGRLDLIKRLLFDKSSNIAENSDNKICKEDPADTLENNYSEQKNNNIVPLSSEDCIDNSSEHAEASSLPSNHNAINTDIKRLSKIILSLGHDVSPKGVAGPLANDERTLRSGPVGISSSKQSGDSESITSETTLSSVTNDSTAATINPNMIQSLRTTGWQRWCANVEQASSTAQLHLLARALERGAHRATLGGRGVSSAISNYVSQHPLPTLRCTSCRRPPDVLPVTTASGNLSAFSVCSGCACPYHLDCLLSSSTRRTNTRRFRPKQPDISGLNNSVLNNSDLSYTGFLSNYSSLSSITSARLEVLGGSLVLCAFCLRSAGVLPPVDNPSGLLQSNNEAFELSTTLVYTNDDFLVTGENVACQKKVNRFGRKRRFVAFDESDAPSSPDDRISNNGNSNEKTDNPLEIMEIPDVDESIDNSHTEAVQVDPIPITKHRGRPSHLGRVNSRRGRRSASCVLKKVDHCDETHDPNLEATCTSPVMSSIGKLCVTVDVHYDDEVEQLLSPLRDKIKRSKRYSGSVNTVLATNKLCSTVKRGANCRLKRASVILDNCVSQITNTSSRGRRPSRGRPRKSDVTIPTSSVDLPDPIISVSYNHEQFDQATAERFLSELCTISSARPLLRCGLGRTVALNELNQTSDSSEYGFSVTSSSEHLRACHRTRSTTSGHSVEDRRLYALDLFGLQEILARGELPQGPGQVISQLRLLLSHWLRSNRPGSRLHQCASDLLEQMNKKLKTLLQQVNFPTVNGNAIDDSNNSNSNTTNLNSNSSNNVDNENLCPVDQHPQILDNNPSHYGKRKRQ
ncbi:Bromodomain adjacent to zinc finger domain protein 1A [Schistosoma japonicum]|nr:Bromodomain adjacent to zinc finger domain protein 1A [Schistosoma japonicum]